MWVTKRVKNSTPFRANGGGGGGVHFVRLLRFGRIDAVQQTHTVDINRPSAVALMSG